MNVFKSENDLRSWVRIFLEAVVNKDWTALRCSGSKTGALALALKLLDLSAWTPIVDRDRIPPGKKPGFGDRVDFAEDERFSIPINTKR